MDDGRFLAMEVRLSPASPRRGREARTVEAMLGIYCRSHHKPVQSPCSGCENLFEYACLRLARCPYGEEKPTCANCPIHCYDAPRRAWMRDVMAFAGPRMFLVHPILALLHLRDGRRPVPSRRKAAGTRVAGAAGGR